VQQTAIGAMDIGHAWNKPPWTLHKITPVLAGFGMDLKTTWISNFTCGSVSIITRKPHSFSKFTYGTDSTIWSCKLSGFCNSNRSQFHFVFI
jgi:hypothetical protein